jgi:hypothetical protein
MAIDIRRCSKEDLDRINAEGRAWRDRNKPEDQKPPPDQPQTQEISTDQLDLEF